MYFFEDKLTRQIVVSGQKRSVILINESGLHALDRAYSIAFPGGFFQFFQVFRFFHIFSCTNVVRVLSFYYICSEIIDRFEHFVDEI